MSTLVPAFALARIGFFGIDGPLGVLLGFIIFCVVVAILFKIVFLALPALGVAEPWISIIYWALVLVMFLMFVSYAFGWGWGGGSGPIIR